MTKADYEARRKMERERHKLEEAKADRREKRERDAEEMFDVMVPGLKAFFDGLATLEVQPIAGGGYSIRFRL